MKQLIERFRHSQLYKEHIKQLAVTQAALRVRDSLREWNEKRNEAKNPANRREELLELLESFIGKNRSIENNLPDLRAGFMDTTCPIDILIPVYNGYDYLTKLLPGLPRTEMDARYIFISDCSTDERIIPLLQEFCDSHENAILLSNEKNRGFVASVNKGLEYSNHHVALVNSDTELPACWLERLMRPILLDDTVASTTPFTNSGTIFSFPNFCQNNAIYDGASVDEVDVAFSCVKPQYGTVPTGMGFCMGMNRRAIEAVGLFDEASFGRGYGEENDWCLRAQAAGFHDVMVENLFVYHKHGGSFVSAEKEALIASHMELLNRRYPLYESAITKYVKKDPNRKPREVLQLMIYTRRHKSVLFATNDWGGGSESYLQRECKKLLAKGAAVFILRYRKARNQYELDYKDTYGEQKYYMNDLEEIADLAMWIKLDEIIVNQVTLYPDVKNTLEMLLIAKKAHDARLTMLMHDHYAICPSMLMVDETGVFCGDARGEACDACYDKQTFSKKTGCSDITTWRTWWGDFLRGCDEVRVFSEDTLQRMRKVCGEELSYHLLPHQVDYLFPIQKKTKTTHMLTIGLLGNLSAHKGGRVIQRLLSVLEANQEQIRIVLIGYTDGIRLAESSYFHATGRYEQSELPSLIYQNDVDVIFIPSIWPETFSYTAEEAMRMGLPVACFNLGAPAERISKYERGLVLPLSVSEDPSEMIMNILSLAKQCKFPYHQGDKKSILYLSEYKSYSSRYRLLHMAEELLVQGVTQIVAEEVRPKHLDWNKIAAVCVYRARYQGWIRRVIEDAKRHGISVIYDIDDAIFDYAHMDYFPETDTSTYGDFKEYSTGLLACMEAADRITVSTDHMALAVRRCLPDKPVYVNRNVASMEMQAIAQQVFARQAQLAEMQSAPAILDHEKHNVTLGYFSGSNTHNDDFKLIAPVLLAIMKCYPNVYLKIGGCLALPDEFLAYEDRILFQGMVSWKMMPAEIAKTDINLMPLEDTFFHKCKSENKWMEAAWVGVPTIASYNEEIASVTSDEENIILCRSIEEWREQLERLILEPALRDRIARAAYETVQTEKSTLCDHKELLDFVLGGKSPRS